MMMPNFLIIGAAKSGTTALYQYLKQHRQIYMNPDKETNYFALEGEKLDFPEGTVNEAYLEQECKTDLASYQQQFAGVSGEIAIGEASPLYLYSAKAVERIKHYLPEAKLIAILRNPVDRAYSNFLHQIREDTEPLDSFAQAIAAEERRRRDNWWWGFSYVEAGFYYQQLKRYFDNFKVEQIKVYLYEDLNSDAVGLLQDIFRFLEVDSSFVPDMSARYNMSGVPKNRNLHNFLEQPHPLKEVVKKFIPEKLRKKITTNLQSKNLDKPELSPQLQRQLLTTYHEDILKLQELIERDLSSWLQFEEIESTDYNLV